MIWRHDSMYFKYIEDGMLELHIFKQERFLEIRYGQTKVMADATVPKIALPYQPLLQKIVEALSFSDPRYRLLDQGNKSVYLSMATNEGSYGVTGGKDVQLKKHVNKLQRQLLLTSFEGTMYVSKM